jgi:hypothetical protein
MVKEMTRRAACTMPKDYFQLEQWHDARIILLHYQQWYNVVIDPVCLNTFPGL